MKNKINILVCGGCIQMIMADDNSKIDIELFDADDDPEIESDWDEVTKNQKEVNF
jgi:hypothetical protein